MSAIPLIEEDVVAGPFLAMPGATPRSHGLPESRLTSGNRKFVVYPADAGFDILDDIDGVSEFALEPNIFFSPRFCVPAMPRLEEREVRLMLLQDRDTRSATRFLMPFTVEKPGFRIGPDLIRGWSNPYGPYGAPLVERRETAQIVDDLLQTLGSPSVRLPKVLALADVFADSPVVSLFRSVALANGLPMAVTQPVERPWLDATGDPDTFFETAISGHHRRNYNRLWRRLAALGRLDFTIARSQADIRIATEEFLLLENAGWKGRQRTSLASDRYRAAFAREAISRLAERDRCRVHMLTLDGRVIASLIVFVEAGRAWTWKTAFDEDLSAFSPGTLLMMRATEALLEDPNIDQADSCAAPDHPVMTRLWPARRKMITLVIGLEPGRDRDVRQAASQIDLYQSTRKTARHVRDRLNSLLKRG